MKSALIVCVLIAIISTTVANDACVGIDDGRNVPDPNSCAGFFSCQSEVAIPGECPEPFHFNFLLQTCDWPDVVNCVLPTTAAEPETSTTVPTEDSTIEDTTIDQNVETTTEVPSVCDNIKNGVMVDNPADCDAFFICVDGTPHESTCPEGLLFNGKYCDLASRVNCGDEVTSTADPTDSPTTTETEEPEDTRPSCEANQVSLHEIPNNCSLYYLCLNGTLHLLTCGEDQHFSQAVGGCISIETSKCVD